METLKQWLWAIKEWLLMLAFFAVASLAATALEQPLAPVIAFTDRHQALLLILVIGLAVAGLAAFIAGILYFMLVPEKPQHNAPAAAPAPVASQSTAGSGRSISRSLGVDVEYSLLKDLWSSGVWRRNAHWRSLLVAVLGVVALWLGICSIFLVAGPLIVRFLVLGFMLYGILAVAWTLAHA